MLHMRFTWAILFSMMYDVIGLGHGGDECENPPPLVGFVGGQNEQDSKFYYDVFISYFYYFIISYRD